MTTRLKVEYLHGDVPVEITVLAMDDQGNVDRVAQRVRLDTPGQKFEELVHAGQHFVITEAAPAGGSTTP